MNPTSTLFEIIGGEHIRSVYQPIVSFRDGAIWGYEALSRITLSDCCLNIEQLFELATKTRKLWELEKLCRIQALKGARTKPAGMRLFLNVDPNTVYDPEFIAGFTREKLSKLKLNPNDIIFEITEKNAVSSLSVFTEAIDHYQQQGFQIAIDDFGSGYSGLARACVFSPNYLKIDMSIVQGVDMDRRKRSVIMGIVNFCREAGIQIIAKGIETRQELSTLIDLGVDYGQGFFLARPDEEFQTLGEEVELLLQQLWQEKQAPASLPLGGDTVGLICQRKPPISPKEQALPIYERMKADSSLTELCVVDSENHIHGILTRSHLLGSFSGQFGYNLSLRRTVGELLGQDFIAVDHCATVDEVAALAMERDFSSVYDAIVVVNQGRYLGVVTVRDLLLAAISIRERNAADASPLTGLPGNNAIQRTIGAVIHETEPYAVVYLDLDNFKAYNDAYGFEYGDCMLKALAQAMRLCCSEKDFMGHIGGDDFVIITRDMERLPKLCDNIIHTFAGQIKSLYSPSDWERGYIVSKDRNGFLENFPIATLSIAAVTNCAGNFAETGVLSQAIAKTKKQCKQQKGNSVIIA
ncbi:GGDEF domain-containing protein [Konateibacter massiliensis]|uniref:GGDEF domain-containing protein n=1 Tax=Konateibacter massiliensis TaxID=2002841 RepID=UPI000C151DCE|nr:bifunctional diguanylate cyclase/phosphodiesterase [Konateibacter massiliensis]